VSLSEALDRNREDALEKVGSLLEINDEDKRLLTSVKEILRIHTKFVSRISDHVERPDVNVSLTIRCIARKTQESLGAIVTLVQEDQGYYGMALLRPMCEELIFARFIKTLPPDDANEYLRIKALTEILEGQKAQGEFFAKQQKRFLRNRPPEPKKLPTKTEHLPVQIKELRKKLRALGEKHGWVKKPRDRALPSVWYMAKATDSEDAYAFFYHAASSAVHANLHHLMRMVWGDATTGYFTVANRNFDTYYRKFVLVYGAWLAMEVMTEVQEEFPSEWPEEEDDAYGIWLAFLIEPAVRYCFPPIVTKEELEWQSP